MTTSRALPFFLLAALASAQEQKTPPAPVNPEAALKVGSANRNREFTGWMKATGTANAALQKLDAKTGKEAVQAAETLGSIYESMIGFWRQQGAADAVKISVGGKAAALELAAAANAGNGSDAAAAYTKLGATCKQCHDAHRSRLADGTFLIRMPIPRLN